MDGVQALGKEGQAWSARVETTKRDVREKKKKKGSKLSSPGERVYSTCIWDGLRSTYQ